MKKILALPFIGALGILVGGGSAFATGMLLAPPPSEQTQANPETAFVPAGKVLVPIVFPDGRLSGYVSIEMALEVPTDRSVEIGGQLPLLLNAINMRAYRTPMASGRDGLLPHLGAFRKLAMEAAAEAFGAGVVRRVAITQAVPA